MNLSPTQQLHSLSLLSRNATIKFQSQTISGQVYYFSEKAIILKNGQQFYFVNAEDYQQLHIQIQEVEDEEAHAKKVMEALSKQQLKASEILPLVLEKS